MIRRFSSSSKRLGISDVYSKLMRWSTTPKAQDVTSENKNLYDPSKDVNASKDEMPDDSVPRVLKVLGEPRSKTADKKWVEKTFKFDAWPTNQYNKDLTLQQIEAAVGPVQYDTLEERFATLKLLSTELNVAFPDRALSFNKEQLKQHLFKAAKQFNEKTPDAIYLDRAEFDNTNIVIEPTASERKALKLRNKKLLQEAEEYQQQEMNKLLNES